MRVVFMGTPEFAVPSLRALAAMPGVEVAGVVTRRDQPTGRGKTLSPPPVKVAALALGLVVLQPGSLRKDAAQAALRALAPEVVVVAAFGQLLPPEVLAIPPRGCLNVHASLLPRWRGASPIAAAILAGDTTTGTTIMRMDAGLDTGDILAQAALPIAPDDTAAALAAKLAQQGADLLADTLPRWLAGENAPRPQVAALATTTGLIRKADGIIDWTLPADDLGRRVRAYTPWPGTATAWHGAPLKVLAAHPHSGADGDPPPGEHPPGTVLAWGRGAAARVGMAAGAGSVLVLDVVQFPGKRALPASEALRGQPALVGAVLPN